jgi:hypothetical protein
MYRAVILGKEIIISNKEYEILVEKWDVKNLKESKDNRSCFVYEIKGTCPFCAKYMVHCVKCPFGVFSIRTVYGCTDLLDYLFGKDSPYMSPKSCQWHDKSKAMRCVKTISIGLKLFRKMRGISIDV